MLIVMGSVKAAKALINKLRTTPGSAFIQEGEYPQLGRGELPPKIEDGIDYSLVLLDIQLPGKDGWKLLEWLKINRKDIPVIVQTAFASIENEIKAKEMGADYFIPKPINSSDLLNKIRSIYSHPH